MEEHKCSGCKHEDLRYCPHCDRVYCLECGRVWPADFYTPSKANIYEWDHWTGRPWDFTHTFHG